MNHPNTSARVLALDLATTTGHATVANGIITSGSQCFARYLGSKSRAPQHVGESFAMFDRWLSDKLTEDKPLAIAYEGAGFFKSAAAVQACVGLRGVMLMNAARKCIPVFSYAPMTVKKFWTGKGNAKKEDMMAATLSRYASLELSDSNEADALAILSLHLSTRT